MPLKPSTKTGIDWVKAQRVFDTLQGRRPRIQEWRRLFRKTKVYGHEVVDEMEHDLIRSILRRLNKRLREEGHPEQQLINFTRTLPDGGVEHYFERHHLADPKECAQATEKEFRKGRAQMKKAYEFHERAISWHGQEYTQYLSLEIGPMPPELEDGSGAA